MLRDKGFGGDSDRATPVPIPNTEVKPVSADGTWVDSPWESRTPPDFSKQGARLQSGPLFVVLSVVLPLPASQGVWAVRGPRGSWVAR